MNSPIPMVALGPDDSEEHAAWVAALTRTIDQTAFCLGSEVAHFEQAAAEYLDVPHALGCNSGTDAIRIGLQAVGVGAGDEVVVPALSFFATASSVAHLGARPVFVDVEESTLTLDVTKLESAITSKTKAVIPVHLYGQGAAMGPILDICEARGIPIVEDAAQCFSARYTYDGEERALGSWGQVGTFSFYPTKNLAAPGDAGLMIARDDEIAARLKSLRVHGDAGGYQHESLGWNSRMDGFQGAVLAIRLERLAAHHAQRAENACRYHELISESRHREHIRPLGLTEGSTHVWHQFIVRLPNRDAIKEALQAAKIGCMVYYPRTLPSQPVFNDLGYTPDDFPVAEASTHEGLALPIHHRLKPEDLARVIKGIEDEIDRW